MAVEITPAPKGVKQVIETNEYVDVTEQERILIAVAKAVATHARHCGWLCLSLECGPHGAVELRWGRKPGQAEFAVSEGCARDLQGRQ